MRNTFVGCETRPPWHPGSLSASLSFTPLCVNDVHERALSQISRLRNTSVRPRQRRAYPVSRWVADVALSQRPGMLTWSRGGSQTQVGSSRTKEQGLLSSASLGREREEPKATYCHCCYVHFFKKRGYGRDKETRQQRASRRPWRRPSVKTFPPRVALETFVPG